MWGVEVRNDKVDNISFKKARTHLIVELNEEKADKYSSYAYQQYPFYDYDDFKIMMIKK